MRRFQLVELEDLEWFPRRLRDYGTDYLHWMESRLRLYASAAPVLRGLLEETGARRIVDLCSGGSGPILVLQRELEAQGLDVPVALTDKFPNVTAFERARAGVNRSIECLAHSVDATAVPRELDGLRTLFSAMHHFPPDAARAVLADAVEQRQPIAIFDIAERSLPMLVAALFIPLFVLTVTPFVRPFRWGRLFFTYVLPLATLFIWWDGIVSQLRAYRAEELLAFGRAVGPDYHWEAGRLPIPSGPGHVTCLTGRPR